MSDRIDRILELLDVGLQDTTPGHYGYGDRNLSIVDEVHWHDVNWFASPVTFHAESVPVQRWASPVKLDQRRMQRDRRRHGKTTQAAVRLAVYRLRRGLQLEGHTQVSDINIHIDDSLFVRDERRVVAECRIVHLPEDVRPTGPFMLPPDTHAMSFIRPSGRASSHLSNAGR